MIFYAVVLGLAVCADILAGLYDSSKTAEGLQKGVAVEGNRLITFFFGLKPTAGQLEMFNLGWSIAFTALSVVGYLTDLPAITGAGIGGLFASAGKHVVGGRNWVYLLRGGNPLPKQTALQKIVGLLSWNEGE